MYKRLKAHASIYLSAEELGVSDYEDEDGEVYPGGEGMLMGDMGPQVYGLDEDEDEEDAPRRMMCRICPEKLLNSEQDVEKHLNSLGHLKSMKSYFKIVPEGDEKEAVEKEIKELEEKLSEKWKNSKGAAASGTKKKKTKKKKMKSELQDETKGETSRKKKQRREKKKKGPANDDGENTQNATKKKRKRKGKNTRMRERKEREEANKRQKTNSNDVAGEETISSVGKKDQAKVKRTKRAKGMKKQGKVGSNKKKGK
mmetsp:Transcript_265/g.401  ORF Transcript_265/g.401 Transcript_265/m.401 type:complete len:256 (-) Transcript_265:116-883(-)